MSSQKDVSRLTTLVCTAPRGYAAARSCCAALQNIPPGDLRPRTTKASELQRIYGVRLARKSQGEVPIGSEDLLERLKSAPAEVDLYVWEADDRIFVVMTDPGPTRLVACLVGRDRRMLEP